MPYATGRILILIVTATIRLVVIATTLAGIAGARAVHAQETAPTPSWGDVGVNWSPVFWLEDLDVGGLFTRSSVRPSRGNLEPDHVTAQRTGGEGYLSSCHG